MTIDQERGRQRTLAPVRIGAIVALALAAAFVVWLLVRDGGDDDAEPPAVRAAAFATVDELLELSESPAGPVYWAGPRAGMRYELSRTGGGRIYVRYLPPGVEAGNPEARYLTVGTYPVAGAFAATQRTGEAEGAVTRDLPGGGIAVYNRSAPRSVYLAFPGGDRQVEVFHPSPATARRLAYSGAVTAIGEESSTPEERGEPVAATVEELEELAAEVDHPVYWLGRRAGFTYELTRLPNGQIYIRYLPRGVEVGDGRPLYETVGSYPVEDGLAVVEAEAARTGAVTFDLPDGGRAYHNESTPTNVHFALPNEDVQAEVFHAEPGRAEELVRAGRVTPIR